MSSSTCGVTELKLVRRRDGTVEAVGENGRTYWTEGTPVGTPVKYLTVEDAPKWRAPKTKRRRITKDDFRVKKEAA